MVICSDVAPLATEPDGGETEATGESLLAVQSKLPLELAALVRIVWQVVALPVALLQFVDCSIS